jgi:DNA-binding beta-propeller fold protein YncE
VTLNDSNGNYILTIHPLGDSQTSFYDVTGIDTNTIGVSTATGIRIINIDRRKILHKFQGNCVCYGITHCDDKLYYCSDSKGIQRFDLRTKSNQLLIPTKDVGRFSYISCNVNKLFYTSNAETVTCCDMNGKQIWLFEDTSVLRSPQCVVVDNHGFVFVAGEKSGNIVVISPDGNSSKEAYQISSPRAMCYDKKGNKILVCHSDNKASWFQISVDV